MIFGWNDTQVCVGCPIVDKSVVIQAMFWCRPSDMLSPDATLTQFHGAFMRHHVSIYLIIKYCHLFIYSYSTEINRSFVITAVFHSTFVITINIYDASRRYFIKYHKKWRQKERNGNSIHQPHDCLLNSLLRRRSEKTSKLHVTGFCARNSPVNSPHKGASNAENVSNWWRHHDVF